MDIKACRAAHVYTRGLYAIHSCQYLTGYEPGDAPVSITNNDIFLILKVLHTCHSQEVSNLPNSFRIINDSNNHLFKFLASKFLLFFHFFSSANFHFRYSIRIFKQNWLHLRYIGRLNCKLVSFSEAIFSTE